MSVRHSRPQRFEELPHTADAAVRVRAARPQQLLARLVIVFGELLTGERMELTAVGGRELTSVAGDRALMAVDMLSELLYVFDTEGVVPVWCECDYIDPERGARARVGVGRYDPEGCSEGMDIKAVTLHGARFEHDGEEWIAEVVLDI